MTCRAESEVAQIPATAVTMTPAGQRWPEKAPLEAWVKSRWRGLQAKALAAAAVETIARGGGLVAGRASGHRPTLTRRHPGFADS